MNVETKIWLVRIGAGAAFIGLCWLSWWMDYRWKVDGKQTYKERNNLN